MLRAWNLCPSQQLLLLARSPRSLHSHSRRLRPASLQSFLPPPAQPRSQPQRTSAHRSCPRAPAPAKRGRYLSRPRPPQPAFLDLWVLDARLRADVLRPQAQRPAPEFQLLSSRPPQAQERPLQSLPLQSLRPPTLPLETCPDPSFRPAAQYSQPQESVHRVSRLT